jgi:hypothetical protein
MRETDALSANFFLFGITLIYIEIIRERNDVALKVMIMHSMLILFYSFSRRPRGLSPMTTRAQMDTPLVLGLF